MRSIRSGRERRSLESSVTLTPKTMDRHGDDHLPLFAHPEKDRLTGKRRVAARLSFSAPKRRQSRYEQTGNRG